MENLKLVIFDMDGLIFDTERLSYESWKEAAKEFNIDFDLNLLYKLLGTNHESVRNTLHNEFENKINVDNYIMERNNIYLSKIMNGEVEKKKGIEELLKYLTDKNIKKAVATSSNREIAYKLLKDAGIYDYYDYILCGDEVKKSKPNPEVFLRVAEKLDIPANQCMVLEDSEAGTIAASRAKMTPVIIPDLKNPSEDIEKLAFKKLNNLEEVINLIEDSF
ncbi:HAD family phosphatase [Clostridium tertium]|jgi:HAD superfamily hydrolase (TIGR01509 family)|uniref:HAD family phosphatase n=1 Tax=Clostridium tertium TaxID=1559 RepID=A0A9X3XG80_9CLOT|nr:MULTISPECIES: HAD family phosphatase [Clostridium]EEH96940.1 HAD hydrolase, family IA [Clostridium sp. 7_2_43FAA]MBS5884225.1 HAD family phosphatase [Clostridium sp.]MBU6134477.1 HAD family phosphatase [Clostridium tertium]MDB1923857.1 HAD family phosphatase [Clostridium tertium]MDB1925010.1 HAD family phosphatase [Clostridium tertium]